MKKNLSSLGPATLTLNGHAPRLMSGDIPRMLLNLYAGDIGRTVLFFRRRKLPPSWQKKAKNGAWKGAGLHRFAISSDLLMLLDGEIVIDNYTYSYTMVIWCIIANNNYMALFCGWDVLGLFFRSQVHDTPMVTIGYPHDISSTS